MRFISHSKNMGFRLLWDISYGDSFVMRSRDTSAKSKFLVSSLQGFRSILPWLATVKGCKNRGFRRPILGAVFLLKNGLLERTNYFYNLGRFKSRLHRNRILIWENIARNALGLLTRFAAEFPQARKSAQIAR